MPQESLTPFIDPEDTVSIHMSRENAKRLARALRMGNEAYDFFDQLATGLGSSLGLTSNSDDTDPLDKGLRAGETITWSVVVGTDPVPIEETILFQ